MIKINLFQPKKHITKNCGVYGYFNPIKGICQRYFCGRAGCSRPECRKRFWLGRVHLVSELIQEYALDKFFTLTVTREMPVEEAWKSIAGIWNKFLTMTRRKYPEYPVERPKARKEREAWRVARKAWRKARPMRFVAVLESHEDGYPHLHGFLNLYIPQDWYSKTFAACGGGKVAWVERVACTSSGECGAYVAKQLGRYVGKENLLEGKRIIGRHKRTIWRSGDMHTKREESGSSGEWLLIKEKCFDKDGKPEYSIKKYGNEFAIQTNGFLGDLTKESDENYAKQKQVCSTCSEVFKGSSKKGEQDIQAWCEAEESSYYKPTEET